MLKNSSTKDAVGFDIETYKKWIEDHFTPKMNWSNIEKDHVKRICLFDVSKSKNIPRSVQLGKYTTIITKTSSISKRNKV